MVKLKVYAPMPGDEYAKLLESLSKLVLASNEEVQLASLKLLTAVLENYERPPIPPRTLQNTAPQECCAKMEKIKINPLVNPYHSGGTWPTPVDANPYAKY